ncbi:FtsX-like permease family protein [Streptococcus catagoni]|uniref:FtsX-like permease family protein n=1 Tax=Streptococcus catagoni TaxID=2654874 RepID=UPI00140CC1DF|nr:FtsX-like permease family protein [Streptococcus catagoni]
MFKLVYYQFHYSKKQWLGLIPVFFVASLIVSTSLIGIHSVPKSVENVSQLFQMLIFFGGATLFLLISNLIHFLLHIFKKEYQLWTILGASRRQLSLLISGQFGLIALLSSFIGTVSAVFLVNPYYQFLRDFVGTNELPPLKISSSLPILGLCLLLVPMIAMLASYYYSMKLLKAEEGLEGSLKKRGKSSYLIKAVLAAGICLLWLACVYSLFSTPSDLSFMAKFQRTAVTFLLLILHLFIIQMISPAVQISLLRLFNKVPTSHYAPVTARWMILDKPIYLKSLQASMIMGVSLVSGFLLFIQNTYVGNQARAMTEAKVSFLVYLGAPILLIIANAISITLLVSSQEKADVAQLKSLGVSKGHLFWIRVAEAFYQSLLVAFISQFFNLVIWLMVLKGVAILGLEMSTSVSLWLPNLIICFLLFLVILVTKLANDYSLENKD